MVIHKKIITLRSIEAFIDKHTLIYFVASNYLEKQTFIKFKILSQTPWYFTGSRVRSCVTLFLFNKIRKFPNKAIHKKYRKYFFKNQYRRLKC